MQKLPARGGEGNLRVPVRNMAGEVIRYIDLNKDIFAVPINVSLMHQALSRQRANARLGTHKTKTRSEVRGGGRKPWRQKGTGRARHGSIREPQWRGGGVAFGPQPRSYRKAMPRKMRSQALRCGLSAKAQAGEIVVVEGFQMETPKTKRMVEVLGSLGVERSALVLLPGADFNLQRSVRNIAGAKTLHAQYLNLEDLLSHESLLIPVESLEVIEGYLGKVS